MTATPTRTPDNVTPSVNSSVLRKRIAAFSRGRGPFALLDQALVSGCNFLTAIVLVRGLGLAEFGKYAILYALLNYANSLQTSFIAAPMMSLAPLMHQREKKQFLEGIYAGQAISCLLLVVAFAIIGSVARIFTSFYSMQCVFAFSFCVGAYQLQDWLRRYYFMNNRSVWAIATDLISYLGQLIVLIFLWKLHHLTLFSAVVTVAATSLLAFAMGPLFEPMPLSTRFLRIAWQKCKVLSRDLLIANQVRWLGLQGVLLIGTGIVGTEAIGGLRATQNMTGPLNMILLSIDNVIPVRLAEKIFQSGAIAAYRFTRKAIIFSVLLFSCGLIPIVFFGKPLLAFLYGKAIVAFYIPMVIQLVNIVLGTVARMWFYLLRALQETKVMLIANGICAALSVVTVFLLGHFFGGTGVVLASTVGQIAIIAVSMWHWWRHGDRILANNPPLNQRSTEIIINPITAGG